MSNIERFRAGVEAINARDWEAQRAMLADDFTSVDYGRGGTVTGPDAFIDAQKANVGPFPDQVLSVLSITETGNTVMAEMLAEGTHTGPLPMGNETIPSTGKQIVVHCAVTCEYDDNGLVRTTHAYVNPLEMLTQ